MQLRIKNYELRIVKKLSILILLIWVFSGSVFGQEAKLIDAFQKPISCGDFMSRIDNVFSLFKKSPDIKIYIIYYGGRYRKEEIRDKKTQSYFTQLKYAHRKDGLNWAKSIPLYLTTFKPFPKELCNSIKENIFLIDGGFRENTQVEIWIGPKDSKLPGVSQTIDEKKIKFRKDHPLRTPDYTRCYEGWYN